MEHLMKHARLVPSVGRDDVGPRRAESDLTVEILGRERLIETDDEVTGLYLLKGLLVCILWRENEES
jgi:hypothetical protein